MVSRGVGETRRWQAAIAVAAALAAFTALIAGSALRPAFSAAAPPEPAAWSAGLGAAAGLTHGRLPALGQPAVAASRVGAPANKTNRKPFHSAWMTKERPLTWNRVSAQSVLAPVPLSFTPIGFAPAGARSRAPAVTLSDRDILTQICVARS
ncbi:hypothetical protein A5646_12135 [Mycobacterium sp. 1245499.0]|uniref:hypothetical protein n=1 Tax=unclassified Mycobacterium TaxID=2642494 RepID=UPI0007FBFC74|nr:MULTISPECIES: hypothetical protein [unclassified Mycobacterium]OBJ26924.1 hypothetical protein A5622_07915 [Mycobacterium sp. 1245801.1]OBL08710.1 hypothetical protein A5646_12135 [Mycobacterium sp. 1245499.0]